ncbi:MAG: VWA domain-containing protein [Planctomycetes bacterium]|nr:VWA domain-containing protein [Planctomycetota bacterium]
MFSIDFAFDRPWYLLLLLGLPVLWIVSFRSLSGLGPWRRLAALALRTAVFTAIVLALAEIQFRKTSDKLTVLYLLDQSQSIPQVQRDAMLEYVRREVDRHRNSDRGDLAGIIAFARDAVVEIHPFDDSINASRLETLVRMRQDATNLDGALKLAQALFPGDTAKRVVIVTDGNENLGNALITAKSLSDDGIGIDVVPVKLETLQEVAIEKISLPSDIRRGQPFESTVVVNNYSTAPSSGVLRVKRKIGQQEELVSEEPVVLPSGKQVFRFQQRLDDPAVYTYEAEFVPSTAQDDALTQNNKGSTFVHVRGRGRVLFIEDVENPGTFDFLVKRLQAMNIEVTLQSTDQLFTSLAELQGYDTVVLANVPRTGGDRTESLASFSTEQIQMLVRNTEQMGCGLVMIGGQNSYGAGGWANTELEKAMPVDFQIKNQKIQAVGALVMVMHASELAQGNYWQKVVGQQSIKTLGPMDYCGVIHWDDFGQKESWLWGGNKGLVKVGQNRLMMLGKLDRMTPGDMPQFEPAMKIALAAFNQTNASVKHMIMISDGDPSPPGNKILADFVKAGVQVSTVAIGTHGPPGSTPLKNIADRTGGKYYVVSNPQALPTIYQREVRKIARPLIKQLENVPPRIVSQHEMLVGIDEPLPPLTGFVMTTVKENPLVEVLIRSPEPTDAENATILASWTYGLGRAVALTTDAGQSWAVPWTGWPNYDKFFSQVIRWSMRPVEGQDKFSIATNVKDGKVQVVVTAYDKDDEFLNFLPMSLTVISPDLEAKSMKAEQVAPGRYVAEFPADHAGSYFVTVNAGKDNPPLISGVNVPYSAEFRDHETNVPLLTNLVSLKPKSGESGRLIEGSLRNDALDDLLRVDTFRANLMRAISSQNIWPLVLVIASCVFFADVFIRRVSISFDWAIATWVFFTTRVMGRKAEPMADTRLERLRSRKAQVAEHLDDRRSAARFEPAETAAPARALSEIIDDESAGPASRAAPPAASHSLSPAQTEQETYTSRLLKAKQKARRDSPPPADAGPDTP